MDKTIDAICNWQRNNILSNEEIILILDHLKKTVEMVQICGMKYTAIIPSLSLDIAALTTMARARGIKLE